MRREILQAHSRQDAVRRLRGKLERDGYPRLQMMSLVAITGAVGFLASYGLLRFGLDQMWVRYVVACAIAYLAFLALLWLWMRSRMDGHFDAADAPSFDHGTSGETAWSGGGGQSGGAGASSSFDASNTSSSLSAEDAVGEAFGSVPDVDEFAIPLLAIALVLVLLLSSLFIVYSAPVLFAEVLLDGVLAASLYRRLRRIETRHWLDTAIRRTVWPFVMTATLLGVIGFGMARYVPEADSIGDVLRHVEQR